MAHTRDEVLGGAGTRLAVRVSGPPGAPAVLLVHGWAQSARVWTRQLDGPLAERYRVIAVDLRGHGDSAAPAEGYDSPAVWAQDVRALLDYAGAPTLLVGWSYGGLVITDYLREFGSTGIAGLLLVGAITEIGRGRPGGRTGPVLRAALPAALAEDDAVAEPALRAFHTDMSPGDLPVDESLAAALRVPARVRAALFRRDLGSAEVLAAVDVPTVVLHGRLDPVVDPAAAEYALGRIPGARAHWLDGVGHQPFAERPDEFDRALAGLAEHCLGALPGVAEGKGTNQ